MTRLPQQAGNSQQIEIYYSPFLVTLASALFVYGVGLVAYWVVAAAVSDHLLIVIVGVAAGLVGAPLLLPIASSVVRPWFHRGPVVTLSVDGVTDVRKRCSFIPWSDIDSINLGMGDTASFLCFVFRRPDRQRQDLRLLGPLGTVLSRFRVLGDWNVTLRLLACKKQEVLRSARRLHQQEIRRRVVELNKGRDNGWSGSL